MKKNSTSKSGFFNPRIFLGFILCSAGGLLGMLSWAAPTSSTTTNASDPGAFKPAVITSTANVVTPAVRDLPTAASPGPREVERDLLRVRPNRPVPDGFVDPAVQSVPAALAAPTPMANFEGQSSVDSGGGSAAGCLCVPPD